MKNSEQLKEGEAFDVNVVIIAACIGVVFIIELFCCIGLCVYVLKRRKKKRKLKAILEIEANQQDNDQLFPHKSLLKGSSLKEKITEFSQATDELKMEFRLLGRFLEANTANAPPNLSCSEAREDPARSHNRYSDMLPFNHNRVILSKAVGEPSTTYINASKIIFFGIKQEFLAVQAPKTNSIENFWQLVIDNQVRVIVMITGLKEGIKNKATQYWPEKKNCDLELSNCTIRLLNQSYPATRTLGHQSSFKVSPSTLEHQNNGHHGTTKEENQPYPATFHHRRLSVDSEDGTRTVDHLQTTAWMDFTAPSRPKLLLDLVYKAQELADQSPGPILVHCSAGVGRTGTFIALYKLMDDYHNQNIQVLDVASTVLQMRKQRMRMVQKKEQYVYIAKCLSHHIADQDKL